MDTTTEEIEVPTYERLRAEKEQRDFQRVVAQEEACKAEVTRTADEHTKALALRPEAEARAEVARTALGALQANYHEAKIAGDKGPRRKARELVLDAEEELEGATFGLEQVDLAIAEAKGEHDRAIASQRRTLRGHGIDRAVDAYDALLRLRRLAAAAEQELVEIHTREIAPYQVAFQRVSPVDAKPEDVIELADVERLWLQRKGAKYFEAGSAEGISAMMRNGGTFGGGAAPASAPTHAVFYSVAELAQEALATARRAAGAV